MKGTGYKPVSDGTQRGFRGLLANSPAIAISTLALVSALGLRRLGPTKVAEVGSIEVAPSGLVSVAEPSSRFANQVTFISLDGVSFPIGPG